MLRKLGKSLTNNTGLKILSILSSIALWLIVMNLDDPFVTRPFQVPVEIINEQVLEDRGEVYEVQNGSDTAVINVRGRRSDMDQVRSTNFVATADLNQIDFFEDGDVKHVPIVVRAAQDGDHFTISRITQNLLITLEDLQRRTFNVETEQLGTLEGGYAIGGITPTPNMIEISGPASLVSQVDRVVASVDVAELEADLDTSVPIVLYDGEGNIFESERLRKSSEEVVVHIQLLRTKEVDIRTEVGGEPAEGFRMVGVEIAPTSVEVMGEGHVLEAIDEILIPESALNIDGADADVEFILNIRDYLEEGVDLVNREREEVAVRVVIVGMEVRTLDIPTGAIILENLGTDLEVHFDNPFVTIGFQGLPADLANLNVENVQVFLDLNGFGVGTYDQEAVVVAGENIQVLTPAVVQIEIVSGSLATPDETTPPGSTNPPNINPPGGIDPPSTTNPPGNTAPPGNTIPPGSTTPPTNPGTL